MFRLGKFHSIKGPGLFMIIPLIDQLRMVDTRVLAVNIPKQQVITRDNVPVTIDGVLFFRVDNPAEAIIMVQDYRYMIAQYSQTSLRDVIGQMSLDQLLPSAKRSPRRSSNMSRKTPRAGAWRSPVYEFKISTCPRS